MRKSTTTPRKRKPSADLIPDLTAFVIKNQPSQSKKEKIEDIISSIQYASGRLKTELDERIARVNQYCQELTKTNQLPDFDPIQERNAIAQDLAQLQRSQLIESIATHDDYIIITTAPLTLTAEYRDEDDEPNELQNEPIGRYAIVITPQYNLPRAVMIDRQMPSRYNHPCVRQSGSVCYGSFEAPVMQYMEEKRYSLAVLTLINMLQTPNPSSTYINVGLFQDLPTLPTPLTNAEVITRLQS